MPRINGRPNVPVTELKGAEIKQDEVKVVSTKSHDIELSTFGGGMWLPDFKLKRRTITDPEARAQVVDVPAERLAQVQTAADFKGLLKELQETHKAFLAPDKSALFEKLPEADRSNYAFINISGRRTEQFFDEVLKLVDRAGLSGAEASEARKAVNLAHRDAFRGRTVDFDRADTGTYWSYGHDAAFVHVFEKMLESLPEDDPKRPFIQNQIDYVFTHKYAPHGGVSENDCEKSLELMAIDDGSRHVVSMTKDSEKANAVRYETLQIPEGAAGEHAGKFVYRDGDKHYFEGTGAEVPAELVQNLKRTPVKTVVFRRALEAEKPRSNFRYDWNGNRFLNTERINTGWWGHCDIKATIETILADMKGSRGVTEYRSDSDKTTEFTRAMQLEALAALLNFDDAYYKTQGSGVVAFGETQFAGGRFDDRPTKMLLKTNAGSLPFTVRLGTLADKDDPSKNVDLDKAFSTKIADENNQSFKDNPDILRVEERDTHYIDATGRKLTGSTDGYSFDSMGRPVESKTSFALDPAATEGERVLIGAEIANINNRELNRYYYDPASKEVVEVATKFVEENGQYVAKEGSERKLGKLQGMELGREMIANDDIQNKLKMLEEAVRVGGKIANDSDTREQVWNGEVHAIRMDTEWRSDDGKWERVGVHIDATFGSGKVGTLLHKLDDEGNVVDSLEVKAAVDFYWRDRPRIAPLVSERGNWFVNRSMYDRGVIELGDGMSTSLAAMQDLSDLIYLGLKAEGGKKLYTIVHEGKRLVYEDEAAWKADVEKLKGTGESGGDTEPGTGPLKLTREPSLAIPDNDPAGVSDVVTVERSGKLKDIKIDIDLKHTYVGDLNVSLVAPDGTEVTLHKRGGRGRDDIVGTYGADLTSFDRLDGLVGKDVKGEWKIKVTDLAGRDTGSLVSWGLSLDVEE